MALVIISPLVGGAHTRWECSSCLTGLALVEVVSTWSDAWMSQEKASRNPPVLMVAFSVSETASRAAISLSGFFR